MISTSVCNSIPRSALALAFKIADQFQNVARRRIAVVDDKIPCSCDTAAPPTRAPFKPSSSINLPAGIAGGFLNMQPALGAAGCEAQRFWLNALIRCAMDSGESGRPWNIAPSAM